jgi:magnesium-transporting ATPase (P-type)
METGIIFGKQYKPIPSPDNLGHVTDSILKVLLESLSINTQDAAYVKMTPEGVWDYKGNKTECALLVMNEELGGDFSTIRETIVKSNRRLKCIPFTSDRKRMTTVVQSGQVIRVHTKGASEITLGLCTRAVNENGEIETMSKEFRDEMEAHISRLTRSGLRTICVCYRDLSMDGIPAANFEEYVNSLSDGVLETDMVMLALAGIKDPVRKEVPGAVSSCKRAGITVRMVTGDNLATAM